MKSLLLVPAMLLSMSSACAQSTAPPDQADRSSPPIQWGPVPNVLPAGAEIAVMQGNPFGEGVYTLRLKMPNGYVIPPHFHPTDEMVTVISGNFMLAMGDNIDRNAMTTLRSGEFVAAQQGMHHYAIASGETIVQVHGMGPFAITYVHPADDPRNKGN